MLEHPVRGPATIAIGLKYNGILEQLSRTKSKVDFCRGLITFATEALSALTMEISPAMESITPDYQGNAASAKVETVPKMNMRFRS